MTMDKESEDLEALSKEAIDLFEIGMYRKALPKFKSAVTMAEKAGDDRSATELCTCLIACHGRLHEVSGGVEWSVRRLPKS